jgi:hypothetical protein
MSQFCWMVYVVHESGVLSGKALAVSVSAGIIGHILLIAVYGGFKFGAYGTTGVLVLDVVVIAGPILVGRVGGGASVWDACCFEGRRLMMWNCPYVKMYTSSYNAHT